MLTAPDEYRTTYVTADEPEDVAAAVQKYLNNLENPWRLANICQIDGRGRLGVLVTTARKREGR
jgi:hypothetical protein